VQAGILNRLAQLEAGVGVPRLDLARVSDSDLERLEAYFLRLAKTGSCPDEFGALPKRLQKLVLKSMEFS
jgi:hypothetical protein